MSRALHTLLVILVAAAPAYGRGLEVRGQVEPAPSRAMITIEGVATAFTATTAADSKGHFRFRKVPQGAYVVTAVVPGTGLTRRSVDVTPGLAGTSGRIEVTIPVSANTVFSGRSPRNRGTVSVAELAIPARARRDFEEAQKKLRKKDFAGASSLLNQAVELAPQYMMAWNALGAVASRTGNWDEAETSFRKALSLRPGALITLLNLGGVLLYRGHAREALEFNQSAVDRSPNNALANFQLGMSYFMLQKDDEALKYLNIAKRLDPAHYASPQLALSDIYLRHGDRAKAIGELEEFLARHPDAPNAPKVRENLAQLKR